MARTGAVSLGECLAEFAQIADIAWYMGGSVALTSVPVDTFEACVRNCKADDGCQYITFDYNSNQCYKKTLSNTATRWVLWAAGGYDRFLGGL